jgi:AraC family transcriptional regulator of adaptative response / DNA-3-methyladenine glycosylase II
LAQRLATRYGTHVQTPLSGLTHTFPSFEAILSLDGPIDDHLGPIGITKSRAKTIMALAQTFESGDIDFGICAQPENEIEKLMEIPGIGRWTASYIAMRSMGWTDAFLETDLGVKKALSPRSTKEMAAISESWRPWRSYATVSLWTSERSSILKGY